LRRPAQLLSLLLVNASFLFQARSICFPVLNCWACPVAAFACPLGALQNSIADMRAVFIVPLYILGSLLAVSAIFGRMMCGWLCPFGLLQEGLSKLNRRVRRVPRWVGYGKYLALVALALIAPYLMGVPLFCKLCPQGALQGGIPQPLLDASLRPLMGGWWYIKIAILAATVLAAVLYKRPFCHGACALGALFSLCNRVSLIRMSYDAEACTNCGWCVRACPQGLDPRTEVNGHACIGCQVCADCPFDALHVTTALASHPCQRGGDAATRQGEEAQ